MAYFKKRVKVLSRHWILRFSRFKKEEENHGYCDPPEAKNKTIHIDQSLRGEQRLAIIIHELTHAANWRTFDEGFVEQYAEDVARILYRDLEYRSPHDKKTVVK